MVRLKNRWLLFHVAQVPTVQDEKLVFQHTPLDVSPDQLTVAIKQAVSALYGDYGSGMQINGVPCTVHILHVSGTIVFIQKKTIERNRQLFLEEKEREEKKGD
ncbi:hypothetical protein BDF14DRAFT_1727318 [Spinellus fusiger]|nr:hypothetical protein BDF14DRAFT_1727318 [Spinellus fusiger]